MIKSILFLWDDSEAYEDREAICRMVFDAKIGEKFVMRRMPEDIDPEAPGAVRAFAVYHDQEPKLEELIAAYLIMNDDGEEGVPLDSLKLGE